MLEESRQNEKDSRAQQNASHSDSTGIIPIFFPVIETSELDPTSSFPIDNTETCVKKKQKNLL